MPKKRPKRTSAFFLFIPIDCFVFRNVRKCPTDFSAGELFFLIHPSAFFFFQFPKSSKRGADNAGNQLHSLGPKNGEDRRHSLRLSPALALFFRSFFSSFSRPPLNRRSGDVCGSHECRAGVRKPEGSGGRTVGGGEDLRVSGRLTVGRLKGCLALENAEEGTRIRSQCTIRAVDSTNASIKRRSRGSSAILVGEYRLLITHRPFSTQQRDGLKRRRR